MKRPTYICLLFVIALLTMTSCIDDVDFDQADGLQIEPVLVSSLAFFDAPAEEFIIDPDESNVTRDTLTNIGIFEDPFVVDNLVRAEFLFEITNSINRAFEAQIELLNDNLEVQHIITIAIPTSPQNQEVITEQIEVFENETLSALTMSTQIFFTLTLVPDPNLPDVDESTPGRLRLRSVGTFFLNIGSE